MPATASIGLSNLSREVLEILGIERPPSSDPTSFFFRATSDGELRYQIIGMARKLVLLLVVFVDRSEPDVEVIHLISARKAVGYEESIYEDQFR